MNETERIESIKKNGPSHLKKFKTENITKEMCLVAIKMNGRALEFVPDEYLTEELCIQAVSLNGLALEFVPDSYMSKEICKNAVQNTPEAIKFVPLHLITTQLCLKLFEKHGLESVSFLPNELRTKEFYQKLVKSCSSVFRYIPKKYRDADLSMVFLKALGFRSLYHAVKDSPSIMGLVHNSLYDHESCLEFVKSRTFFISVHRELGKRPFATISDSGIVTFEEYSFDLKKILRWYDVCEIAVPRGHLVLKYVPKRILSADLCRIAVDADGHAFMFVPEKYKSQELCELAVNKYPWNLEEVPEEFISPEMCMRAVKESGFLLRAVPDNLKTYEMCKIAILDEGTGFKYVPDHFFDRELALLAIENARASEWQLLHDIPERLRDYDVCLAAVKRDGEDIKYVPERVKDYKICYTAAQKTGSAAEYIPQELFTPELVLALTKKSAIDFDKIPKDCLTSEACIEAIKQGSQYTGTVIGSVPMGLMTQEMCDLAIKISVWSLKDIPEQYVTEDMLLYVAQEAPGRLEDNFPKRLRTDAFVNKVIEKYPSAERYIKRIMNN